MTTERITTTDQPDELPITLEEAKAHAKITEDHEDELLRSYLEGALDWAREQTRRAIVRRGYLITRDRFPIGEWLLPLGRIATITDVRYIDVAGVLQTWGGSPLPYDVDLDTDWQPRLQPKLNQNWPSTGEFYSAAQIRVEAGWATDDIPFSVRSAILLKFAELEQTRAPGDPEASAIDAAASALLEKWALPSWA